MKEKLLHRGSVKDIYQISEQELLFRFSNRYSIFDWGEMPDAIPNKGRSLAALGNKLLAYLTNEGFSTHFIRAGDEPEDMIVKAVRVPRDEVEIYETRPNNILVPLEVIYRFGAPKGSSLLKRFTSEAEWIEAGFDRAYQEGEDFSEIKIDFTTKLERLDRVLTEDEAKELSGMNSEEWRDLKRFTEALALKVREVFAQSDLKLWDGKFEFAFDENRKFMLVDSIGLDEIRLTFHDSPLSKELLRQSYLSSDWYHALTRSKAASPTDFKNVCLNDFKQAPEKLEQDKLDAIADIYDAVANLVLNDSVYQKNALHARLSTSLQCLVGKS